MNSREIKLHSIRNNILEKLLKEKENLDGRILFN